MVLLAELLVLVYALAESELPRFNRDLLATASLLVQWVVLSSAALLCLLRRPLARLSLPLATAASLALVMAMAVVSSAAALTAWPQVAPGTEAAWWSLRNGLIAAVIAGIVLRNFYLQQQLRLREQAELQARLDSLRARIRPHFLFNTMNSIARPDRRPAGGRRTGGGGSVRAVPGHPPGGARRRQRGRRTQAVRTLPGDRAIAPGRQAAGGTGA